MFRGKIDGLRLGKDNTVRIPLSLSKLIGTEEIGIYGNTHESCLSLIPLSRLDKIDVPLGMCFGHYALNKKNRLYLPEQAQQFAGIENTSRIIIIGMFDYMEVWSNDVFDKIFIELPCSAEDIKTFRKDMNLG